MAQFNRPHAYHFLRLHVCISYRFWDIQRRIMACPWNLGWGLFKVIENTTIRQTLYDFISVQKVIHASKIFPSFVKRRARRLKRVKINVFDCSARMRNFTKRLVEWRCDSRKPYYRHYCFVVFCKSWSTASVILTCVGFGKSLGLLKRRRLTV